MLERCLSEPMRGICKIPIRHFKTMTTMHGIVWLLDRDPTLRFIVMTHEHARAEWWNKRLRPIATEADVGPARGQNTIVDWSNEHGGGVVVMSAVQSSLGRDLDILICDDPLDEHGAFDANLRDTVDNTIAHYTARAGRPGRNGSVLIVASPWHPDDPVGRREQRKVAPWEVYTGRALTVGDDGVERAFAPEVMTVEMLHARRDELREVDPTERIWYAQFQCEPLPDALGLFRRPTTYDALPSGHYRTVIGADLSYSSSRNADFFALLVLKIYQERGLDNGRIVTHEIGYAVDHARERWDPAASEIALRRARLTYPGAPIFSYMSGPEIGIAHYLAERQIPIEVLPARYSKRQRAQRTIDRCNAGRIRFPAHAPWVSGFVSRMILFSGDEKSGDDDDIDALVSANDGGMNFALPTPRSLGKSRSGVVVR